MEGIILIGHGSPLKDANLPLRHIVEILKSKLKNRAEVEVAYLQFAQPTLQDAIANCIRRGAKRLIIHPYFLSSGRHVTVDIPNIVEEARGFYPHVEFIVTEPLGECGNDPICTHYRLADIIMEKINNCNGLRPYEIEKRSFEIISNETDLSGFTMEEVPIIQRVIHATGDFEFQKTLIFHPDAINAGIRAIKAGKDILVDVKMVEAGINKRFLERWGGRTMCNISGDKGNEIYDGKGETRAAAGIEMAPKENVGIVAIGNAPTALLKAIGLINRGIFKPDLVIGVPVGFVNAVEAKALLSFQNFPFITSLGRKGGSPVAVAIVNALLKMTEEEK